MPTLTITLHGEAAELKPYLQCIAGLLTKADLVTVPPATDETPNTDWTLSELTKYWSRLSTNAKTFLKELAKKPSGYPAPELKRKTSLDTKNLGGACNSASNQLPLFNKQTGNNRSKIFDRRGWENNGYVYTMPQAIADLVTQLP